MVTSPDQQRHLGGRLVEEGTWLGVRYVLAAAQSSMFMAQPLFRVIREKTTADCCSRTNP